MANISKEERLRREAEKQSAQSYEQQVQTGFNIAKEGNELPTDATPAMREGFQAAQVAPPPAPVQFRAESTTAWDDEKDDVEPQPSIPQENKIFVPAPAPKPAESNTILVCRAESVIRRAHEKADEETKVASALLADPFNPAKIAAFEKKYADSEIPPPPPRTPYGDKDEDWLKWEAAHKPEEFIRKNSRCAAPLVQSLLKEIAARNA